MRRKGLFILVLGVIGVIALANAARYTLVRDSIINPDQVVIEKTFTLSGSRDSGLVALAEQSLIAAESQTHGDMALISSSVQIDGTIDGDLTVLGDTVTIGPDARISGNATLLVHEAVVNGQIDGTLSVHADHLDLSETAQAQGGVFACAATLSDSRPVPGVRSCNESDIMASTHTLDALRKPSVVLPLLNVTLTGAVVSIMASAAASLALAGLAILAVIVFPQQVSYIEEAIRSNPRGAGSTGVMMLALAAGLSAALALLLVLLPPLGFLIVPVYLLLALGFFGMGLAGWITMTLIAGDLLLRRLGTRQVPPLVIAATGNISLLLLWNLLALNQYTAFIGFLALLVLGSIGLGATYVTRLGTRPIHRSYLVQA